MLSQSEKKSKKKRCLSELLLILGIFLYFASNIGINLFNKWMFRFVLLLAHGSVSVFLCVHVSVSFYVLCVCVYACVCVCVYWHGIGLGGLVACFSLLYDFGE